MVLPLRLHPAVLSALALALGLVACGSSSDDSGVRGPGGDAGSSGSVGGASSAAGGATGIGGGSPPPPVADFAALGPLATTSAPLGPACTFFYPTALGEGGRLHPVIVWGNGTLNTPANYTQLFNHFASHGFIVAAANTSNSGSGAEMIACLDYITAQNAAPGPFQGKVDLNHLASSGYSQGGAGCLMAGRDPRFTVTLPVSPFVILPLGGFDPASVGQQTHPMFMISGDADVVAAPAANQQPIFAQAQVPIVWGTRAGATHFEVLGNGNSYRGPMTAWFRYKLMGDATAGAYFEKTPCTVCTAAGWSAQHNALWR